MNAPKLGPLNGFEIFTRRRHQKFLKELSRKFLVMICMTQNRGPWKSFSFTKIFGKLFSLFFQQLLLHTHSFKHDVFHECFP